MKTIDQVRTTIYAYNELIERAADEMLKVYSYAPRGYEDLRRGDLKIGDESDVLLRQAALLEPGQSTETRVIQSKTSSILDSEAKGYISAHIESITGAKFVKVTGDSLSYEFKAQAYRNNDGCTIHTTFDARYGGNERLILIKPNLGLIREESIDENVYSIIYIAAKVLLSMTGLSEIEGNQIEFVKKIRDDDLIPGINLSSLSDEEIEESLKNLSSDAQTDTMRFIMQRSGLSNYEFAEKIARLTGTVSEFDLSQLSFRFEYDIEIDEETFQSYFESDEDSEEKSDAAKIESSIFTPEVIRQINRFINTELYNHLIDFDIEEYSAFSEAVQSAENGQTEFEFNVDTDAITDDLEIFDQIMNKFFDGYLFGREYRYITHIEMTLDKEAKDLFVSASLDLVGWGGGSSNADEFVVLNGGSRPLSDYVEDVIDEWSEEYCRDIDFEEACEKAREEFIDADRYNHADSMKTTVISLEE